MNMTAFAFHNNRVVGVVVFFLVLAGSLAFISLPKSMDPGFTVRTVVISTQFPGASPDRVEQLITDRIEKKIQEMPEIDDIQSESRTGLSFITVNFLESYMDMQPIFDDLRRKVEDIQHELPEGSLPPFINEDFGDVFGHVYTLTGEGFTFAELNNIAEDIRDNLLKEKLIAKVDIYGNRNEEVYIEYNNSRLTELRLSPQQLASSLQGLNIISPGGHIELGPERITLEPTGNFENIAAIRNAVIRIPNSGELVRLDDIVSVYRGYEDPVQVIVKDNGTMGLAFSISMREGGNILELGEQLAVLIPELEAQYPHGISLQPRYLQSKAVGTRVSSFISNLVQSISIVIVVMVLSLGWKIGFIVASLIPIVMISTFFVMSLFGIGIDQVSLAALIISLGLLVDNAIVTVESILTRRERGESAPAAAIATGKEMWMPLLVSSLTTAAAFTPVALAESAIGEFTASIFYVVTISLLISWMISMMFLPMLTQLLAVKKKHEDTSEMYTSFGYRLYRAILMFFLKNRLVFGVLIIGVFASAIYIFRFVPAVFIPDSDEPVLTVKISMPTGTKIEETARVVDNIETMMQGMLIDENTDDSELGIYSWVTYIGNGGPRFFLGFTPEHSNPSKAIAVLNVRGVDSLSYIRDKIEEYAFLNHPDALVRVQQLANGPPVDYPLEIRISGPDENQLYSLVSEVKTQLVEYPGITAVRDNWGQQTKKLVIDVDQGRALRAGVTSSDIAMSLSASLSGMRMTDYREGDDIIPVTVRADVSNRADIAKLDSLTIYSSQGEDVPLKQVADVSVVWQASTIVRRNRERTITVQVQLDPAITANEINQRFSPWLKEYSESWPAGYSYSEGGESESSDEASASVFAKLPLAGMMILLLLVAQFNSVRRPLIILSTIPLGIIGVAYGLFIADSVFGFFALLGVVSLSGIIINNAIVLIDRIDIEVSNGSELADAVVHSCLTRARPIALTTATTVGGMIPLWLGGGPMFEPMAIAILFGLMFATVITLLMVPVLFSVLFRVKFR